MAAFAITQVVLDELHCSILRSILTISVRDWEGPAGTSDRRTGKTRRGDAMAGVRASNAAAIALYESLGFNEARFAAITTPPRTVAKTPSSWLTNQYVRQGGIMKWDWIFFDPMKRCLPLTHSPACSGCFLIQRHLYR